MVRPSTLVAVLTLAACAAPSGPCALNVLASVPFRIDHDHLAIDAELNGQPTSLIFDTGAATSVLTNRAVERLGLQINRPFFGAINGIGGSRSASLVEADTFSIRNLHGRDFLFLASNIFGDHARGADGLLSTDFLSRYDIDLDLPGHRIDFFKATGNCGRPTVALTGNVYAVPLLRDGADRRPRVEVSIDGKIVTAVIDTGAPFNVLFRSVANRLGLPIASLKADRTGRIGGIGPNPVVAYRHLLQTVTIGDIAVQNMPINIADEPAPDDAAMILGLNFISRVHLWISVSSSRLIIQYPPLPSPLDDQGP